MVAQARTGDEAPAAAGPVHHELRAEVIALREHQKEVRGAAREAGIAPPAMGSPGRSPRPARRPTAVRTPRRNVGRRPARTAPVATTHFALPPESGAGRAARALADQCLRSLPVLTRPGREQAARHLAAAPLSSAAPAIAAALSRGNGTEGARPASEALAPCGGEAPRHRGAASGSRRSPLVRMAALEALCASAVRSRTALELAGG